MGIMGNSGDLEQVFGTSVGEKAFPVYGSGIARHGALATAVGKNTLLQGVRAEMAEKCKTTGAVPLGFDGTEYH